MKMKNSLKAEVLEFLAQTPKRLAFPQMCGVSTFFMFGRNLKIQILAGWILPPRTILNYLTTLVILSTGKKKME
jgi:hypothetical protein